MYILDEKQIFALGVSKSGECLPYYLLAQEVSIIIYLLLVEVWLLTYMSERNCVAALLVMNKIIWLY